MSNYALRQFRWQNRAFRDLNLLEDQFHLIYPAVRTQRSRPKKSPSGKLRLLFVGNNFMRKGGPAVLRAHEELRKEEFLSKLPSCPRWSGHQMITSAPRRVGTYNGS